MPIVDGHVALVALHAGFSRLTFPQKGSSLEVAASLLSDEETLTQRQASLTIDSQKLATELPRGVGIERRLWPLFVLLALLIALFEWWTYHRRVTV